MTEMMLHDQVFKTKPYDAQLEALLASRDKEYFAYLMEMGTGKSKVLVDNTSYLFAHGKINGLVIVTMKSLCRSWSDDLIPTHLPDSIDRHVVVWRSSTKSFESGLKKLFVVEPLKLHVLIMNIDAVKTDRGYEALEKFLLSHNVLLAIDESIIIKNHKAEQTKIMLKFRRFAKYRRILNGTPVPENPLDAYAQFEFLSQGCLGSSNWHAFRNRYAVLERACVNGRWFDKISGFQRLDELKANIQAVSFRKLKRECLDLPEKIYVKRYIEASPEQLRYYKQLRDDAIAFLNSGETVTAPLVLTRLLRLRQALCNFAQTDDGQLKLISDKDPRLDELMTIVEQAEGQKGIIWGTFIPVIKRVCAALQDKYGKDSCAVYCGEVSQEDRNTLRERFQDPKDPLRWLVIQSRMGGFGLTLTEAQFAVYYDNDWSLVVRNQSEDRNHRIGQKNNVTYIDLIVPGTVDERIANALLMKQDLSDQVTGDNLVKNFKQLLED